MIGLKYIPDLKELNGIDDPPVKIKAGPVFSEEDMKVLLSAYQSIEDHCFTILEIGIGVYAPSHSSSHQILRTKKEECLYFGVDIEDRSGLKKEEFGYKNFFILDKTNSSEFDKISSFILSKNGNKPIDFIHIDGFHSINQILCDWKFVELLAKDGVVVLHDTNYHYGPVELLKAIDPEVFTVEKFFERASDDWGISVLRRR